MPQSPSQEQPNSATTNFLLTVSIVTFEPDLTELKLTLESLAGALDHFDPALIAITLIDNSPEDKVSPLLKAVLGGWNFTLIHGQGNVGFGHGHNLALSRLGQYHLILNPDIELAPDALQEAVQFMQEHPSCGLVSPYATWPDGRRQYLCKRFPAVFDLLLRGFAPEIIRNLFRIRLRRYEMFNETQDEIFWNPPIISGCFMFFCGMTLRETGGFDPRYFLYFEDFDLSIRCAKLADIAYVPTIKIIHAGGHASRKGAWHIRQFAQSAARFYAIHGYKFI